MEQGIRSMRFQRWNFLPILNDERSLSKDQRHMMMLSPARETPQ